MSNDTVITVESLSKAYVLGERDQHDTFFGALAGMATAPLRNLRRLRQLNTFARGAEEDDGLFWALKDVSFEVKRGEVLGIIGRNGAGKSTLLKILSKIAEPTRGRAEIRGRVSALLEVGTGFHPELSGRENVYLNGTILGMRKTEIDAKFDEIVAFSGVEKFLDTPVKRYSSGMTVRLAFAVAAHLEPEILIIDEVLAVGDAEFQKKCLGKMQEVATGEGRTVLFVSHNMGAVRNLCARGILLQSGSVVCDDVAEVCVNQYLGSFERGRETAFTDNPERSGSGEMRFLGLRLLDESDQEVEEVIGGKLARLSINYENPADLSSASVIVLIFNSEGVAVTNLSLRVSGQTFKNPGARGELVCSIPKLPFPVGRYRVSITLEHEGRTLDAVPNALFFTVTSTCFFDGGLSPSPRYCATMIEHTWRHTVREAAQGSSGP